MIVDSKFNRLRWQCRRGMLELDLLLLDFLESRYPQLDEASQQAFVALLEYPDQSLQRWLIGTDTSADVDMAVRDIVKIIRSKGREYGVQD
ncbi:MAG: succinate dehydrogenase assembly factor 2 [Pseudomonadota bacterium]